MAHNSSMELLVRFSPPGFFLNDPRVEVRLGGRLLYEGGFLRGFECRATIGPGVHVLETTLGSMGSIGRPQRYELNLTPEGGYPDVSRVEVELTYNRLGGNFDKRASISAKR